MELIEKHVSFGGWQNVYRHYSQSLKCEMNVGVYLPPKAANEKLPVLYWLSGLTCNEQNFITKSGMQRYAAEHNIIVVAPDTSPRGSHVADADRYDLGQGAGFYLNATQAPWNEHYKMYDYIRNELPDLVMHHFRQRPKSLSLVILWAGWARWCWRYVTQMNMSASRRFRPLSPHRKCRGDSKPLLHILLKIKMPGWITTR